jgi:hypothetical protein
VQSNPCASPLDVDILTAHLDHGADAGKGVDHRPNQRLIAQADLSGDLNHVE